MPTSTDSPSPPSRPLTLQRLIGAVAASAVSFAILPLPFSATLAVTVCGVIVLDGMRLPVVTDGVGVKGWLPWVVWLLGLMVCPVATCIVGEMNPNVGTPAFSGPLPWATIVVVRLGYAQIAVSVVAAIAVVVLTRGRWRWTAWAGILVIGMVDAYVGLYAWMSTSGIYL